VAKIKKTKAKKSLAMFDITKQRIRFAIFDKQNKEH